MSMLRPETSTMGSGRSCPGRSRTQTLGKTDLQVIASSICKVNVIDDLNVPFLYKDADGFHFMNNDNYDQVQVPEDIIGSAAPYLQENMTVKLSLHGVIPVAIQTPQRPTLAVAHTH